VIAPDLRAWRTGLQAEIATFGFREGIVTRNNEIKWNFVGQKREVSGVKSHVLTSKTDFREFALLAYS